MLKPRLAALAFLVFAEAGFCAGYEVMPIRDFEKHPDLEEPGPKKDLGVDSTLPAFPKQDTLVEFYVAPEIRYQVFVDTASLSVSEDGVVRFSTVIRTEGGANNVSYNGVSCDRYARIIYASGRSDNTWAPARNPAWRAIDSGWGNAYYRALVKEVFCDLGVPSGKPADMVRILKNAVNLHR